MCARAQRLAAGTRAGCGGTSSPTCSPPPATWTTLDSLPGLAARSLQELCSVTLRAVLYDGLLHGKSGSADMDPVLTLLADVARGLEFIHSKHIIHGDLVR